ncbi:MAG: hypothetical protein QXH91_09415, partial [Candidatus Bathyarchaeia archaeon]
MGILWHLSWILMVGIVGLWEGWSEGKVSDLEVECKIGYDGLIPVETCLIPVYVKIKNHYRPLKGRILITQPQISGAEVELIKEIEVGSPASLFFSLYPRVDLSSFQNVVLKVEVQFFDPAIVPFVFHSNLVSEQRLVVSCGIPNQFWD